MFLNYTVYFFESPIVDSGNIKIMRIYTFLRYYIGLKICKLTTVNYWWFEKIYSAIQYHDNFFVKILTKFLKEMDAGKGTLVLFKITTVQKFLQIHHTTDEFAEINLSKSLLNSLRKWVPEKEPSPYTVQKI